MVCSLPPSQMTNAAPGFAKHTTKWPSGGPFASDRILRPKPMSVEKLTILGNEGGQFCGDAGGHDSRGRDWSGGDGGHANGSSRGRRRYYLGRSGGGARRHREIRRSVAAQDSG